MTGRPDNIPGKGKNPDKYVIRDCRDDDFGQVLSLWQITGLTNPARMDNEQTISVTTSLGGKLLVIEDTGNGMICGTSWMTYDGRRIYLHHFGIHPECRGKKLAKKLLDESLAFVRRKGVQVKLEVNRSNIAAIELYKKAGFNYLGDYDVYIIRDVTAIPNAR